MSADAPQYQHFIPQFILKNFDHPFSCPKAPTNGSKCKKHHHEKGKYPGDRVVNCLELLPQGYKIEEHSIRRVCGLNDMYMVQSPYANFPRELEAKFSKLEGETSAVIRRIITSHHRGDEKVIITRTQQTVLRKFVYLLNQRGSGFFKTYNCDSIDDYKKIDRDLLKEFMDRNGIERPLDVWLQGMSSIIDLDMRVTANWQETLKSSVYYGLFCHFQEHITEFWMSFCTPLSEDEEFILPDTGSHVYEGPTVDFQDKTTGEFIRLGPRFHLFAPISPLLMIVLRSKHLPEPHEDNNPETKAGRQLYRQVEIDSIHGPGTKSILEDLPVHKAINSYSTLVNGILRKRPGWDGQLRQTDTFSFPFFKISAHHARIINGLLLDHAFHGLRIIFNKKGPFLDLLEWFLTEPCEVGKRLGGEHHAEQMRYLARLTALMHAEGRNISLHITNGPINYDLDIESYKNQNNDAARWLESLEKSHASGEKVKKNREKDPDAKVDAGRQGSVDPQDQPKNEKCSIEGQPIDLGPTVKHDEEISRAKLTSLRVSELSTQHQSANVQGTHPIQQLSMMYSWLSGQNGFCRSGLESIGMSFW
ncbi:hypothetical protein NW761_013166 [Fusarium oxysporum]|nr:hypothetical protein NW758_012451 [Fusarium oxysporum]KAJ4033384.1 hypothetical protein NW753_012902 [Fusarium oxysporum]KAJ4036070.1 hypothetical protein NW763_013971 [Fusarium oxysporum]KAJ4075341.1 hypothetical protein NW761_013166 [Fusarium oxysporum]KAJ4075911.1 hypothetical protein NW756_013036 [Fusarium oxysporum]